VLANLDGSVDSAEIAAFDDLLRRLPLPQDSRAVLRQYIDAPPGLDALVGGFMALEPEERKIALAGLVPIVLAARRGDRERLLFCDLAERIAIDRDSAERMLER
jgi:uncharacterized membrane protein YebE (DUF533 family)